MLVEHSPVLMASVRAVLQVLEVYSDLTDDGIPPLASGRTVTRMLESGRPKRSTTRQQYEKSRARWLVILGRSLESIARLPADAAEREALVHRVYERLEAAAIDERLNGAAEIAVWIELVIFAALFAEILRPAMIIRADDPRSRWPVGHPTIMAAVLQLLRQNTFDEEHRLTWQDLEKKFGKGRVSDWLGGKCCPNEDNLGQLAKMFARPGTRRDLEHSLRFAKAATAVFECRLDDSEQVAGVFMGAAAIRWWLPILATVPGKLSEVVAASPTLDGLPIHPSILELILGLGIDRL